MKNGAVVWRGKRAHWVDHQATAGAGDYQIAARNAAGWGPWTEPRNARLPQPVAPTAVLATSSSSVRWSYQSSLAAGFALYGLTSRDTARYLSSWPPDARAATDHTLSLLRSWDRYRVCAYNSSGMRCSDETS
jgi:hypothetical protein